MRVEPQNMFYKYEKSSSTITNAIVVKYNNDDDDFALFIYII